MIRTQIQLTDSQASAIRQVARQQQTSMAEVIRRCIDTSLADQRAPRADAYRRARAFVGALADPAGATNVAVAHDRFLADAFE